MAGMEGAVQEFKEQQSSERYRGGTMSTEQPFRSEETIKREESDEETKREIMKLREERKKEARKQFCIIDANVDGIG